MRTINLMMAFALVALAPNTSGAQELQQQLKDAELGKHWIYDDLDRAFVEAKMTRKPILAQFR